MGLKEYPVIFSPLAEQNLEEITTYLSKRASSEIAKRVVHKLVDLALGLKYSPARFGKELWMSRLDGDFRSCTKWSYKVIYEITDDSVVVHGFFHTSQDPGKMALLALGD